MYNKDMNKHTELTEKNVSPRLLTQMRRYGYCGEFDTSSKRAGEKPVTVGNVLELAKLSDEEILKKVKNIGGNALAEVRLIEELYNNKQPLPVKPAARELTKEELAAVKKRALETEKENKKFFKELGSVMEQIPLDFLQGFAAQFRKLYREKETEYWSSKDRKDKKNFMGEDTTKYLDILPGNWLYRINPVTNRDWWNLFKELCAMPCYASMPFVSYYNNLQDDADEAFHITLAELLDKKNL